jgi:hypothetical protein
VRKAADVLGSRLPRVRDPAAAYSLAYAMDALLRNLSKGLGAVEVAIGEGLDALNVGRRAMDLETWLHFAAEVPPEKRPVLEEGQRLAGIALGAALSIRGASTRS